MSGYCEASMVFPSRLLLTIHLLVLAGSLSGCSLFYPRDNFDPVSGNWTGAWYRQGENVPAGSLHIRLNAVDATHWLASVSVGSEVEVDYEFMMQGRREGSLVLFQGVVDLGRAGGGNYSWNGEIDGRVFQGIFRHPSGDGRFELVRRPEPESTVHEK